MKQSKKYFKMQCRNLILILQFIDYAMAIMKLSAIIIKILQN